MSVQTLHVCSNFSINVNIRDMVGLVREKQLLWLVTHENYRNTTLRQKEWFEIARKLHTDFDQLERNKQKLVALAIIKRWKSVRDTFFHSLRRKQSRPYMLEQELKFLLTVRTDLKPYVYNELQLGDNVIKTEGSENDGVSEQFSELEVISSDHNTISVTEQEQFYTISDDSSEIAVASKSKNHFSSKMSQPKTMRPVLNSDDNQAFFDSIKPTVRTLSIDRKLGFRIEVLRLLRRIKLRRNTMQN